MEPWVGEFYDAGMRVHAAWMLQEMLPALHETFGIVHHFQLRWPGEAATLMEPLRQVISFAPRQEVTVMHVAATRQTFEEVRDSAHGRELWEKACRAETSAGWVAFRRNIPSVHEGALANGSAVELRRLWIFCELLLGEKPYLAKALSIYLAVTVGRPDLLHSSKINLSLLTAG
jgi:hypothetical protein